MLEKGRRCVKWLSSALYGHFSFWTHSLRTILMAVFVLLMTYMLVKSKENSILSSQFNVYIGETLFIYIDSGFNLIMTSAALTVMMSELPKRVSYQNYMVVRLSRYKWLVSLVSFCLVIVGVFFLAMLASSAILSFSFVTSGGGWSDMERLSADPDYAQQAQYVAEYIREVPPFAACVLASAVLYLFWVTMVFLILFFSLLGAPNFGVMFAISLLLLNITILFESLPGIKLPSHFATLGAIASQVEKNKFEYVAKVICGYIVVDALLLVLMTVRVKNMDIRFIAKE